VDPRGRARRLNPDSLGVVLGSAPPLAWVAGPFKSPPLRTAIRPAIRASTRPCTRKSKRSVTADVLEKLLHTCVLERVVDVRDHALLLLPLLPAGGATPSGCGQDGAVVLVGSPGVSG
jgi:hypothetical protein